MLELRHHGYITIQATYLLLFTLVVLVDLKQKMKERKREELQREQKSDHRERSKENCKKIYMLKQRKNTFSLHYYTHYLFGTYSFTFEITFILLDSVFFSLKLLVLLDSEKVLLYLNGTKLIPY